MYPTQRGYRGALDALKTRKRGEVQGGVAERKAGNINVSKSPLMKSTQKVAYKTSGKNCHAMPATMETLGSVKLIKFPEGERKIKKAKGPKRVAARQGGRNSHHLCENKEQ